MQGADTMMGLRKPTHVDRVVGALAAAWNETNAHLRKTHLDAAWSEHGRFVDPEACIEGRTALNVHIGRCQARHPGARFVLTCLAEQHHDAIQFTWALRDSSGAWVIGGRSFGELDADGRIRRLVAFFCHPST